MFSNIPTRVFCLILDILNIFLRFIRRLTTNIYLNTLFHAIRKWNRWILALFVILDWEYFSNLLLEFVSHAYPKNSHRLEFEMINAANVLETFAKSSKNISGKQKKNERKTRLKQIIFHQNCCYETKETWRFQKQKFPVLK